MALSKSDRVDPLLLIVLPDVVPLFDGDFGGQNNKVVELEAELMLTGRSLIFMCVSAASGFIIEKLSFLAFALIASLLCQHAPPIFLG